MSKQNKAISFDFNAVSGGGEYTLIPVGRYAGVITDARFVDVKSTGEQRLWVQFRINGPKQSGRYVTTLCVLDASAPSAYKTKSLVEAAEHHLGGMYVPANPAELIGAFVAANIVVWTPRNGNTTNDIGSFALSTQKAEVEKFVEEVASHFDIAQAEVMAAKAKQAF
jgi:hypothetical protein